MRLIIATMASVCALSLTGCGSEGLPGLRPLTYASPGEAKIVLSGVQCPHDPDLKNGADVIGSIATAAAGQLLDNFGQTLTKAAAGGALPASTATINFTPHPGDLPQCIILMRGEFTDVSVNKETRGKVDLISKVGAVGTGDTGPALRALKLPQMDRVDYYIELKLIKAPGGKALTFAPVYLWMPTSLDGSTSGSRDLSIALRFKPIGGDEVGAPILLPNRQLGIGKEIPQNANRQFDYQAPWFGNFSSPPAQSDVGSAKLGAAIKPRAPAIKPAVPASGDIEAGAGAVGSGGVPAAPAAPQSRFVDLFPASGDTVPVTLTSTVVETRPERGGLAFVASVFTAAEPTIKTAVGPALDSTVASANKQATLTVEATAQTAFGQGEGAMIAYCQYTTVNPDPAGRADYIQKSSAASAAQLVANSAALAAHKAEPYPDVITISDGAGDLGSNKAICAKYAN